VRCQIWQPVTIPHPSRYNRGFSLVWSLAPSVLGVYVFTFLIYLVQFYIYVHCRFVCVRARAVRERWACTKCEPGNRCKRVAELKFVLQRSTAEYTKLTRSPLTSPLLSPSSHHYRYFLFHRHLDSLPQPRATSLAVATSPSSQAITRTCTSPSPLCWLPHDPKGTRTT
jgi:hypothetical protein